MIKFVTTPIVQKMCEVSRQSYECYWEERNGGNDSVRILAEEVAGYEDDQAALRCFNPQLLLKSLRRLCLT